MRKRLITILSLILIQLIYSIEIKSQVVSKNTDLINHKLIKNEIETYVNSEIEVWQRQGRFESSEDYKKRVTIRKRKEKIKELTKIKTAQIAKDVINLTISSMEYDPDNEVYKIILVGLPEIYVQVPNSNNEAYLFDKYQEQFSFLNPIYTLTDDGFALLSVSIKNPENNKYYYYSYTVKQKFKNLKIIKPFNDVEIETCDYQTNATPYEEILTIDKPYSIDENIPSSKMDQPNAIAVIIGNKDYNKVPSVEFAIKDARLMKKYFIRTLGIKESNILYFENINKTGFEEVFGNRDSYKGKLYDRIKPNTSDVYIYYSGHGAPGLENLKGYFIPLDCDPNYIELGGYSLDIFYSNLSKLPAKSITVVLDACFSGEGIHNNISSILPKINNPVFNLPNGVLFTSSTATQVSCWYNNAEHGLFTYFFLKAIHEWKISDTDKNKQLTFDEIYNYISSENNGVPYYARSLHGKEQNPTLQGNKQKVLISF